MLDMLGADISCESIQHQMGALKRQQLDNPANKENENQGLKTSKKKCKISHVKRGNTTDPLKQ